MNVKRFAGANSRAVLQQVRAELGPDAVILANKPAPEGIEILAMSSLEMADLVVPARSPRSRSDGAARGDEGAAVSPGPQAPMSLRAYVEASAEGDAGDLGDAGGPADDGIELSERLRAREAPARAGGAFALLKTGRSPAKDAASNGAVAGTSAAGTVTTPGPAPADPESGRVLAEIRTMKGLLTEQLAALAWGESVRRRPLRGVLLRELIGAGFGATLARAITERLPDDFAETQARQWMHGVLARNLRCQAGPGIVERGGMYALVGPTGVGKTTTAAKIAAQCVVRHGARGLGLITTDSYRVGAHDQLRIYGKILGVPVFAAQDATELEHALAAVAGKHLVLIDTIGMGQRDTRVAGQQALLSVPGIQRLLLLNATAQTETLEDVVRAYASSNLDGAIITKTDEAVRLGGVLDVAIRRQLALLFVTNGQRVPEDLHVPTAQLLVHQALRGAPAVASDADMAGLALCGLTEGAGAHA